MTERSSTRLRKLLAEPGVLIAPVAYDCVSARIIEETGFKVIFHGGYSTSAPLLGLPDIGLITMTEMLRHAGNIASTVDVPVVCDVDDGFGDVWNVMRTTREAIKADLAGMHIEDQEFPKRCPSIGGGSVIPREAMQRKIRAAVKAREESDPDFIIIARTYAGQVNGIEDAVERGIAYAKEGADIIFTDLSYTDVAIDELKLVAEKVGPHAYLLANMTETVGRPLLNTEELDQMGYKLAYYAATAICTAAGALQRVFKELMEKGTTREITDVMMPFRDLGPLLRMDEYTEIEKSMRTPPC